MTQTQEQRLRGLPIKISSRIKVIDDCWVWQGTKNSDGYGRILVNGRRIGVHRVVFELLRHRIPLGLVTDHKCLNPACVNPAHLEIVTNKENVLRGTGLAAINARKTHCSQGHTLSGPEADVYITSEGFRACRACQRFHRTVARKNRRLHARR